MKRTKLARASVLLITAGFLSACVSGRTIDYKAPTELSIPAGSTRVAIAVLDHRPYVVSGAEDTSFVGHQNSGFPVVLGVVPLLPRSGERKPR